MMYTWPKKKNSTPNPLSSSNCCSSFRIGNSRWNPEWIDRFLAKITKSFAPATSVLDFPWPPSSPRAVDLDPLEGHNENQGKPVALIIHPGRLTWNLQITHLERKMIFQTSMIMFHVHLQGCKASNFWGEPSQGPKSQWFPMFFSTVDGPNPARKPVESWYSLSHYLRGFICFMFMYLRWLLGISSIHSMTWSLRAFIYHARVRNQKSTHGWLHEIIWLGTR